MSKLDRWWNIKVYNMLNSSTNSPGFISSEELWKPQVISWQEGLLVFNISMPPRHFPKHFPHLYNNTFVLNKCPLLLKISNSPWMSLSTEYLGPIAILCCDNSLHPMGNYIILQRLINWKSKIQILIIAKKQMYDTK